MKGVIKKQKKHKDTEIYLWGKEIIQISFTGKKSLLNFFVHRKETDTWSTEREELHHTGNQGTFWFKTLIDDWKVVFLWKVWKQKWIAHYL